MPDQREPMHWRTTGEPIRVACETVMGVRYEGVLLEIDNGTAILRCDDGTVRAGPVECCWTTNEPKEATQNA